MVQFGNLNKRDKTPVDKAVRQGKIFQIGLMDLTKEGYKMHGEELDENPLQNDFYQSSYTFRGAPTAQRI